MCVLQRDGTVLSSSAVAHTKEIRFLYRCGAVEIFQEGQSCMARKDKARCTYVILQPARPK